MDLYILTGPTGVGKTQWSLFLAKKLNAEIISCDALLVYEGMNIGTAKPSFQEQQAVNHYGIDLIPVHKRFDIQRYIKYAYKIYKKIQSKGKAVLVVGGSGFYLKSFFAPVVDSIKIPVKVQRQVREFFEREGPPGLLKILYQFNSVEDLEGLDLCNPRRVIKALERCIVANKSYKQLKEDFLRQDFPFKGLKAYTICLTREQDHLQHLLKMRIEKMFQTGLLDEVESLMLQGIENNPAAATAIGYRECISFLKEKIVPTEDHLNFLKRQIYTHTWQLVKKQRTWLRTQIAIDLEVNLDKEAQRLPHTFRSMISGGVAYTS